MSKVYLLTVNFRELVTPLREQRQMVEVESPIATRRQPDVHDVVRPRYEADEAGHEEHRGLGTVVGFGDRVRSHRYQAGSDDQQGGGGQHGSPVLPDLRVAPAVGVGVVRGQVAVLLYQRVAIPRGGIIGVL